MATQIEEVIKKQLEHDLRFDALDKALVGDKDHPGVYENQRKFKDFINNTRWGMRFIFGAIILIGIDRIFR